MERLTQENLVEEIPRNRRFLSLVVVGSALRFHARAYACLSTAPRPWSHGSCSFLWCRTGPYPKILKRVHVPWSEIHRERPPGLLQHVLIVLVFWSLVLPLTRLPPSSRSLRLCLWASILLYGPVDIAWICCSQLPHHPCKNGMHSTCFYSTGGGKRKAHKLWTHKLFESRDNPGTSRRLTRRKSLHFLCFEANT